MTALRRVFVLFSVLLLAAGFNAAAERNLVAELVAYPTQMVWKPLVAAESIRLTVTGPGNLIGWADFPAGSSPSFISAGNADGAYTYELLVAPVLSSEAKARLEEAADTDTRTQVYQQLIASGEIPATALAQSGGFTIEGGMFIGAVGATVEEVPTTRQLIADDLAVTLGLCVGANCTDSEDYAIPTAIFKETNVRLLFEDVSDPPFPGVDWQLTINDSISGGANRFSVEEESAGRTPFTITAGAPTNSLFVAASGNVGLGTAVPQLDLQITSGDTPAIRFEQTNTGGFAAQSWDIRANEFDLAVRDITGSTLPFKVKPDALTNSLIIQSSGNVSIGNLTGPAGTAQLEVFSNTSDVALFTNTSDQTSAVRISVAQAVVDQPKVEFVTPLGTWGIGINDSDTMVFQKASTPIMKIDGKTNDVAFAGAIAAGGGVMHASDMHRKTAFTEIDAESVLDGALGLNIAAWQYKDDPEGTRHIGPTAQEFASSFGVGANDQYINTIDADGVALAAIQGLNARLLKALEQRDTKIAELEARLAAIERQSRREESESH